MAFSSDNNYLATKNDNMPNVLFIWDLNIMSLQTVLIHLNEVFFFDWEKNKNILFISTNNNKLYYFTLDSCKILQLSKDFQNKSFIISNDGQKMMIKDNNYFITVNIDEQNDTSNNINTGDINENEIMDNQNMNNLNNFIGQGNYQEQYNMNEQNKNINDEGQYEEMQENMEEQDMGEEQIEEYNDNEEQYEEMQMQDYGNEEQQRNYEGEEQIEMINNDNNNYNYNNYGYQGQYENENEQNIQINNNYPK